MVNILKKIKTKTYKNTSHKRKTRAVIELL